MNSSQARFSEWNKYVISRTSHAGFALTELIIVIAILAIITVLTLPTYKNYIIQTQRKKAMQSLLSSIAVIERFKVNHGFNYQCLSLEPVTCQANGQSIKISPPLKSEIPPEDPHYDLAIAVSDDNLAYTLTASPKSTSILADDGDLSITSSGKKRWRDLDCWPNSGNSC